MASAAAFYEGLSSWLPRLKDKKIRRGPQLFLVLAEEFVSQHLNPGSPRYLSALLLSLAWVPDLGL